MQTFIIWTTKKNSYMAPIEKAKLPGRPLKFVGNFGKILL